MNGLNKQAYRLLQTLILALVSGASGLAAAETDYDVTMRMVADDDALDSSFVQQLQIPESLTEMEPMDRLDAGELSSETQDVVERASSQARETRDALDLTLPGEGLLDLPLINLPELPLDPGIPADETPNFPLELLNGQDSVSENPAE